MNKSIQYMNNQNTNIVYILLILLICTTLTACSINEARFMVDADSYRTEKLNTVIDALNNKDIDAIKSLFSRKSLEAVGEDRIEIDIKYLFAITPNIIQHVIIKGGIISEDVQDGKRKKGTYVYEYVTDGSEKYFVYFLDCIVDTADHENVGISQLTFMTENDARQFGQPDKEFVGIFRPDQIDALPDTELIEKNRLQSLLDALQNKNANEIESLFSIEAREAVGTEKIINGAEYLFTLFQGSIVSCDSSNAFKTTSIIEEKVVIKLEMYAYVTTDIDRYIVYYRDFLIDKNKSNHTGIDQLTLTQADDTGGGNWRLKDNVLGIYCPGHIDPKRNTTWENS